MQSLNDNFKSSITLSGSSFFGYGPKMQVGPGDISEMICACSEVQRQDITMSSGKFTASSSLVDYDPVATCETSTAMIMTWNSNTRDASATTKNLAPIADVTSVFGFMPTTPTEVD